MSPRAKSPLTLPAAAFLLSCWLLAMPCFAPAQVIKVEAGASDILPSQGGSIHFQGPNYEGYAGAGDIGGVFRFGSYLKTSLAGYDFTLGDQSIAIRLPTDIFGASQYFLARGVGVTTRKYGAKAFLYAGTTARAFGAQFFQGAEAQVPVGMFFLEIPLSDKLAFSSKNVGSRQQTSIQSLDWRPYTWLRTGVSGGIGSNQPYFAATTDVNRDWLDVKAAYIRAGDRFRRLTTPSVFSTEADRENVLVTVKPYSSVVLTAGHQNFLAPQANDLNAPFQRASVDQLQSTFNVAQFHLGAGIFQSHSQSRRNVADGFSASRKITRSVDASVSYYQNLSGPGPRTSNLSGTIREIISPKLSLLQVVNRAQGSTTVLFGGSYTSNRLSVNVDYQTLYMPFLPNPLANGINVTLQLKLFGNFRVNGQTSRSPDGRLRYTAYASTLLTPRLHGTGGAGETFKIPKYVIRGHVRDEHGAPIEGVALRIGTEIVTTNEDGEFLLRQKKNGPLPLTVLFEQFVNPLRFRVVAAPPTVTAEPEDSAQDVQVVLAPAFRPKSLAPPLPPPQSNPASPSIPVTPGPQARGPVSAEPNPAAHDVFFQPKASSQHITPQQPHSGSASALLSRSPNAMSDAPSSHASGGASEVANIPKYVVRGHVRDENGAPLAGIAVPIGDEVVFTNANGEFALRQKRPGLFPLAAAFEESANPRKFRVIAAPSTVSASPEASVHDVLIVLAPALPNKQT